MDNENAKDIPLLGNELEKKSNELIRTFGFKNNESQTTTESGCEETYRTNTRRQRDKILYTGGFRRLQDKTQVMAATLTGDHRTRLTHTLEVEQIATSIANTLGLNSDLVSAISLGHDVGHTPFGHAAERSLNELLKDNGGFHHPIQSVRYIWEKYGNKIDDEIYKGIISHDSDMYTIDPDRAKKQLKFINKDVSSMTFKDFFGQLPTTLEAQVVVWADKIAYITHDLEDFLRSSIYTEIIKAEKKQKIDHNDIDGIENELCEVLGKLIDKKIDSLKEFELRDLIRCITTKLIKYSANNIEEIIQLNDVFKQKDVQEITKDRLNGLEKGLEDKKLYLNSLIINFDDKYRESYYELRKFLDDNYIMSPQVQRSDAKAQIIINSLFESFTRNYKLLPLEIRSEIDESILKESEQRFNGNIINKQETNISELTVRDLEILIKNKKEYIKTYETLKKDIITRKVAAYISTMADTYAENMYCNLTGSKDNYIL